jgi:hypothetical protein
MVPELRITALILFLLSLNVQKMDERKARGRRQNPD